MVPQGAFPNALFSHKETQLIAPPIRMQLAVYAPSIGVPHPTGICATHAAGCEPQPEDAVETAPAAEAAASSHVPRDFEIVINHYQEDPRLVRESFPGRAMKHQRTPVTIVLAGGLPYDHRNTRTFLRYRGCGAVFWPVNDVLWPDTDGDLKEDVHRC